MNILFNCTTNVIGGGVKNSAIFIKYALADKEMNWLFAVSPAVQDVLSRWGINDARIHIFSNSPARNKKTRHALVDFSKKNNVNLVYTMAGPAYVNFPVLHVMGISNPYITHGDLQSIIINRDLRYIAKMLITTAYQSYYARMADHWLFQTETARDSFVGRFKIPKKRTNVIPNAIGNEFIKYFSDQPYKTVDFSKQVNIFCPAADYWHKGISLIPKIAFYLKQEAQKKYNFRFILTLKKHSELWEKVSKLALKFDVGSNLINIGPYNYAKAVSLYEQSDIVFVPSILETFSASYLEAFASKRPLIAADKEFARQICKNAALYINPFDGVSSAKAIHELISDQEMQLKLEKEGEKIINTYGLQSQRVSLIFNYLKEIASIDESSYK